MGLKKWAGWPKKRKKGQTKTDSSQPKLACQACIPNREVRITHKKKSRCLIPQQT